MLPKSCPRCGGWVMHQTVGADLIEFSCVMCGWVTYRDIRAWDRIANLGDGPRTVGTAVDNEPDPS